MTTVLDAFAVIAALAGEAAAPEVEAELRKGDSCINAVNLAEVVDQMIRQARRSPGEVEDSLGSLVAGGLDVVPADESIGRLAGGLRARHYDRRTPTISLADCVAVATCVLKGATLATADQPLAAVARKEGVRVLGLPSSTGKRPEARLSRAGRLTKVMAERVVREGRDSNPGGNVKAPYSLSRRALSTTQPPPRGGDSRL